VPSLSRSYAHGAHRRAASLAALTDPSVVGTPRAAPPTEGFMARGVTVVGWLLAVVVAGPSEAQTCRADPPRISKPGFRPNVTISYAVTPSPRGVPFPPDQLACVWRAFQAWTDANDESALGVRFVPGPGGIVVRYDDALGLLPRHAAAGWTRPVRADDGGLVAAEILLSPDGAVLDRCDGVTKTVLHELGHLHGLADRPDGAGPSVMNDGIRKNDRGGRIPLRPTPCDAAQARVASAMAGAVTIAAQRDLTVERVAVSEGLGSRPSWTARK
jgi:hypothetical protein